MMAAFAITYDYDGDVIMYDVLEVETDPMDLAGPDHWDPMDLDDMDIDDIEDICLDMDLMSLEDSDDDDEDDGSIY